MSVDSLKSFVTSTRSIRIQDDQRLKDVHKIDSVAIVGSTCSGKSTVVDAIRHAVALKGLVDVPMRYITRPKRGQDNTIENAHLDQVEFQEKVDNGDVGVHWVRKMEGDREERYGFHRTSSDRLAVYSGNNALYDNPRSIKPEGALQNTLMIGMYAPDDVRENRLRQRSPDLFRDQPDEVAYRLRDSSNNMLPHIHIIVDNYGSLESDVPAEVVKLIELIAQTRRASVEVLEPPRERHRGKLIRVATQKVRFSNGIEKTFEFAERSPGVRTLVTDGDKILLTKEWRSETSSWDYRLPGGKMFDSLDEYLAVKDQPDFDVQAKAAEAARKELGEEALLHLSPEAFSPLHLSVCGATVVWDLHYYLAHVTQADIDAQPASVETEEGEHTRPEWFTNEQVKELCLKGAIQEDRTTAVLLRYILSKSADK